jgi:hypothetical protein
MKMPHSICIRLLMFVSVVGMAVCGGTAPRTIDVSPLTDIGDADQFLKFYVPVTDTVAIAMPQYSLPLDLKQVTNYSMIADKYLTIEQQRALLKKNGFVVIDGGMVDDITKPYQWLREQEIPIYITVDTPLHLFHIQFDETLRDIEEQVFYNDIVAVTRAMLQVSENDYTSLSGELKEAAKRNVAYFAVALTLFEPEYKPPSYVKNLVDWECSKIEAHEGLPDYDTARTKALFRIPEDYSQYKPRGHYTRSDTLRRYFKGMMWFGRMTFLMKGHEKYGPIIPPDSALTDRETARIQTLQAMLIAARTGSVVAGDKRRVIDIWNRIYVVTAFYAGFADDLTIYDYREAMREVFGPTFEAAQLAQEALYTEFLLSLAQMKPPAIFSGTGGAGLDPGGADAHQYTSVKHLDNILTHTMGFRFMGQRYIPDSYILGQLVSPAAGTIPKRIPERFSVVYIPDERIQPDLVYSIRGFPRGLDVFSVLGSDRAAKHIEAATDHEYPKYEEQVEKLREEFARLTDEDWNRNLYWSWLYALKTLCIAPRGSYQTYQMSGAWLDRQLNTALASWAALRHNTILYAKQSYTPVHVGITSVQPSPPPPPPPKGLVEPLPRFYARILATTRMAYRGLKELEVLSNASEARLVSLMHTLETLYGICIRQVGNQPLSDADNEFLGNFPNALKAAIGDVDDKGLKTTIIADVHSDLNTMLCLEEASGYVDLMIVAYKRPSGDIVLAIGPVFSYYEFKHPLKDRLTDETWQDMLQQDRVPDRPDWIKSFYGG